MSAFSDSRVVDDNLGLASTAPVSPLQTCSECEALIDITDHEPLAKIKCPSCSAQLVVRGQIGPFRLESVAGRGGMGVVYKALDTRLNRHVALKLLRRDHSDNQALIAQLATEAATTASINHPHVVKVFSTGTDRGRFYIAMELVNQGSLDDLMRLQGRVAEAQILDVAIQIAQGLRAAQQHGLIHRDVKPGNILFDDNRSAKIVDFGLAIFMEDEELARGEIWGTPYYVAPEKLDHKPEDFRSDIYSLGGSMFHALAGRPPFEAENASLVALKHLKAQPVSLQAFAPHISGSTAYVINRTLLKDPDERYQSYDELIEHLEYAQRELTENIARPQQRRVVLETAADQKAWGWITAGMIIVILGLAIAGFFLKNPSGGRATTVLSVAPQVSRPAETSIFRSAREKLAALDTAGAAADFRKLAADSKLPPTESAWAVYQQGIAELASGELEAARATFGQVKARAASIPGEQPALAAFFTESSQYLKEEGAIPPAAGKDLTRDSYQSAALLAFGLHNWHGGHIDDAMVFLRQFRAASPTGTDAWINGLKAVANPVLETFANYLTLEMSLASTPLYEDLLGATEALQQIKGPLSARAQALLKKHETDLAIVQKNLKAIPPNGIYRITNKQSGKALTVAEPVQSWGSLIIQQDYKGKPDQQWFLHRVGATVELTSALSGNMLDLSDSSTDDGAKIVQWGRNGTAAQRWSLRNVSGSEFKIVSMVSGKTLGLSARTKDNGVTVVQGPDADDAYQIWTFAATKSAGMESWLPGDIGEPHARGTATGDEKAGQFTIKAAGKDIWNESDSFFFFGRPVSGDFEFVARSTGIVHPDSWARAGIMIRETRDPTSKAIFTGQTAANGGIHQVRRDAKGSWVLGITATEAGSHQWRRIIRKGDTCQLDSSADGVVWATLETYQFPLPHTVEIGLAVSSHDPEKPATATFENVSVKALEKSPAIK